MIQTELPQIPIADGLSEGSKAFNEFKGLSFDDAIEKVANGLVSFGFKLLIAILVFYIGRFIIRKLYKMTLNVMTKRRMDASLTTFCAFSYKDGAVFYTDHNHNWYLGH